MFYAVAIGKKIGIYDNWDITKLQVIGFKGSKFKKFKTIEECQHFINLYNLNKYEKSNLTTIIQTSKIDNSINTDKQINNTDKQINNTDNTNKQINQVGNKIIQLDKCIDVKITNINELNSKSVKNLLKLKFKKECENKEIIDLVIGFNLDKYVIINKDINLYKIKKNKDEVLKYINYILNNTTNTNTTNTDNIDNIDNTDNTDNIDNITNISNINIILHRKYINSNLHNSLNILENNFYLSYLIFTDGSLKMKSNDNIVKYGYYRFSEKTFIQQMNSNTTNNQSELLAIYTALIDIYLDKKFNNNINIKLISIISDSEYCINSLTIWYKTWYKNNWLNSKGKEVKNKDIIKYILTIIDKLKTKNILINFIHQNSHQKLSNIIKLKTDIKNYISLLKFKFSNYENCKILFDINNYKNINIDIYDNIKENIILLENNKLKNTDFINLILKINELEFIIGNYIIDYMVQN